MTQSLFKSQVMMKCERAWVLVSLLCIVALPTFDKAEMGFCVILLSSVISAITVIASWKGTGRMMDKTSYKCATLDQRRDRAWSVINRRRIMSPLALGERDWHSIVTLKKALVQGL